MKTYEGPFTLADDLMVWNVTKEDILVRTVKPIDEAWPPPPPIDQSLMKVVSKEIGTGALDVKDVDQTIYDRINKKYGTNFKHQAASEVKRLNTQLLTIIRCV